MKISVIIPVYDEEKNIVDLLERIKQMDYHECIVVDADSSDNTLNIAKRYNVTILSSKKGRAFQMNAGAKHATGDVLWFLHADTRPKIESTDQIKTAIQCGFVAGAFKHKLDVDRFIYRWIAFTGNLRSKLTNVYYGDQGIFVKREIFDELNGYPSIEIFEDLIFTKNVKTHGATVLLDDYLLVSARRWHKQGISKTFLLNQFFYWAFCLGFSPKKLATLYLDIR